MRKQNKKEIKTFTGTVQANDRGFAFILPDDKERYKNDFFVPRTSLHGVYDGDKVLACHVFGTKDEAKIIKVIERGITKLTGTLEKRGNVAKVYPDNSKLPKIIIPASLLNFAKNNDKVLCEITSFPQRGLPHGKIIEILGRNGDFDAEELSIIRTYGLNESFPENVLNEAEYSAKRKITPNGVRDLRGLNIFTVDGEDTRDIDDGISIEMKDGNYVLGVHIADVSRYVNRGTELDREAYERGTSVYFPDRVLPMLPKSLSNGACSLNENEDRYALSCIMTFDDTAKRTNYEIFESIIRSQRKMTYTAVNAICSGDSEFCTKYADIVPSVNQMQSLCLLLEEKRKNAGNIDLAVDETKIYVDENGEIIIKKNDQIGRASCRERVCEYV